MRLSSLSDLKKGAVGQRSKHVTAVVLEKRQQQRQQYQQLERMV